MKSTVKFCGIIALIAVIGFSMIGCGKSSGSSGAGSVAAASASGTQAAPGSGNTAAFLVEYEKFVDEYISTIQRVMAGDAAAAAEAATLETRAEEMSKRFDNLSESDFTPEQIQKWEELTQKMMSAFGL